MRSFLCAHIAGGGTELKTKLEKVSRNIRFRTKKTIVGKSTERATIVSFNKSRLQYSRLSSYGSGFYDRPILILSVTKINWIKRLYFWMRSGQWRVVFFFQIYIRLKKFRLLNKSELETKLLCFLQRSHLSLYIHWRIFSKMDPQPIRSYYEVFKNLHLHSFT